MKKTQTAEIDTVQELLLSLNMEHGVLKKLMYKFAGSFRREKVFNALKKLQGCMNRFSSHEFKQLVADSKKLETLCCDEGVEETVCQHDQHIEWILQHCCQKQLILQKLQGHASESYLHAIQKLRLGHFAAFVTVICALSSRIWFLAETLKTLLTDGTSGLVNSYKQIHGSLGVYEKLQSCIRTTSTRPSLGIQHLVDSITLTQMSHEPNLSTNDSPDALGGIYVPSCTLDTQSCVDIDFPDVGVPITADDLQGNPSSDDKSQDIKTNYFTTVRRKEPTQSKNVGGNQLNENMGHVTMKCSAAEAEQINRSSYTCTVLEKVQPLNKSSRLNSAFTVTSTRPNSQGCFHMTDRQTVNSVNMIRVGSKADKKWVRRLMSRRRQASKWIVTDNNRNSDSIWT